MYSLVTIGKDEYTIIPSFLKETAIRRPFNKDFPTKIIMESESVKELEEKMETLLKDVPKTSVEEGLASLIQFILDSATESDKKADEEEEEEAVNEKDKALDELLTDVKHQLRLSFKKIGDFQNKYLKK